MEASQHGVTTPDEAPALSRRDASNRTPAYFLAAKPGFSGIQLRADSEGWERDFATLEQAISYARSVARVQSRIVIINAVGKEVAEIAVDGC